MTDAFRLDFTGIGVFKAGTTWLARCLAEHPQVCFAASKETNFFLKHNIVSAMPANKRLFASANYGEGFDWYRGQYRNHQPGQLYGEYSNAYIADPESARLLYEHHPAVKLICCFRNPVEVVQSGYAQASRAQPLPDTLEVTLEKYPQMLRYGYFHAHLQPFLRQFPRSQFHLMLYDDVRQDPAASYRGVCRFLGIDDAFAPASLHQAVNPRTVLRSTALRNLRYRLSTLSLAAAPLRRVRKALFRCGVGGMVQRLFERNEKVGVTTPMAPETRARLVAMYREDVLQLGTLLGRDLSAWFEPPKPKAVPS
ncbi:MAG: sulfotransferase domain-containing protein [Lentisphaerae bacterium]|nr:sulfotransferase domain-containing protein [Lentisphaerota bacterium]